MLTYIRAALARMQLTDCTISQKGGGRYTHVKVLHADEVGIAVNDGSAIKLIPWTSINEVVPS